VWIVEDEMMVAMLLEDMLQELGFTTVGPVTRLERALAMAPDIAIDAAVLDLNLNGELTYVLADVLRARGIPFIFATGYGEYGVSDRFRGIPTLQKPFERMQLSRALDAVTRGYPTNA
jgi:two-component SAPR family response regulator